jgi:CBS domain-containing protein
MGQSIKNVMTSNPCTIDADKSVAYAAKMMRDEDVGLAPVVEGDKLIGMLTDRDIAVRVAAQGRDPEQVKVRDVASKKLVTIDPQQDLDEALRIMAKHQIRRLPVVEEDGRLVGVVAQADIARKGDETKTGQLVEEISEPGGQMSSFEEGQFQSQVPQESPQEPEQVVEQQQEQPEEEGISRVAAASSRGRRRTRRASTTRARSTTRRKTTRRKKATAKKSTARKATRKRAPSRKKAAAKGGRKTARRKKSTARKTTRKKTTRKKSTARKTTRRKSTARKGAARKTTRKRSTARKATGRKTTRKRTTRRKK